MSQSHGVVVVSPTEELLRPIVRRDCKKNDFFTVSILKFWAQEYEDKLAELLHSQLTRSGSSPNKKRQRSVLLLPLILILFSITYSVYFRVALL